MSPNPTNPTIPIEDPDDPCADMPPLLCGTCDKAESTGGWIYELETPTTIFCQCGQANSHLPNSSEA